MEKSKTLIPLHYFYDEMIFEQEKQKLFPSTWTFVGFSDDLEELDAYISIEIFGQPIVIKNFNGQLRAFLNVCSHRFSKLCLSGKGKGPLQCPYHGWTYNEAGLPYAIPRRKQFGTLDLEALKLKSFSVEKVGRFLFLRLSESGVTLQEYLDETYPLLEKISMALGAKIDTNTITIRANWKIIVENTLEEYHVRQVHPDSLCKVDIQSSEFGFQGLHSSDSMTFKTKFTDFRKLPDLMKDRKWHVEDYIHQLIFPNMTIASAFGTTIAIQQIIPINAETSCFISHVFSAKLDENEGHALVKAFNQNAIEFNRQVFEEDRVICESVQEGITHTDKKSGLLSKDEERAWFFEKCYMEKMK